jgi:hypothetical protein
MDEILKSKCCTIKELQYINRARLFYRALTLSVITMADGTLIDPRYYEATCDAREDHSSWRWPTQPMIMEKQRKLWENAICTTFINQYNELKQPLGRWITITRRRVSVYYTPEGKVFMQRDTSTNEVRFHIHEQIGNPYINSFAIDPSETVTAAETQRCRIYVPADSRV